MTKGLGRDGKESAIGSQVGLRKATAECFRALRAAHYAKDDPRLRVVLANAMRHLAAHIEACRDRM
jgi:hypothetical protein